MANYRPAISAAKLRRLERTLYDKAIDGDARLGLYLLKLYYKDLQRYDINQQDSGNLIITLPGVSGYDDI